MAQRRDGRAQGRATRGSVALRVLLFIVGLTLILFGTVITFATIAIALEDDTRTGSRRLRCGLQRKNTELWKRGKQL